MYSYNQYKKIQLNLELVNWQDWPALLLLCTMSRRLSPKPLIFGAPNQFLSTPSNCLVFDLMQNAFFFFFFVTCMYNWIPLLIFYCNLLITFKYIFLDNQKKFCAYRVDSLKVEINPEEVSTKSIAPTIPYLSWLRSYLGENLIWDLRLIYTFSRLFFEGTRWWIFLNILFVQKKEKTDPASLQKATILCELEGILINSLL